MQPQHQHRYGYNHLETDDEVLKRLRSDATLWVRLRQKYDNETFDQWLDANQQTRKLIYIP
jgi:hypothetical protein